MRKRSSTTRGFISILGPFPTQCALLLTFVATVSLPKDEDGNRDWAASPLYHCIWVMHLSSALIILANQHAPAILGICNQTLTAVVTLFNVTVLIFMAMEFFVTEEQEVASFKEQLLNIKDEEDTEAGDADSS